MSDSTNETSAIPEYDAQAIETKWQRTWEEEDLYKTDTDPAKPKKYVLEMFPYPSGDLHMGHARNYTIGDAMARQARMRGYDVLHPMGFDAFGLPAENAAIKHHTQAAKWTYQNIAQAVKTMKRMGFSYDYDRMFNTCDPEYYRWGQWMFIQMWKRGLAYRATSPVNWCPTCKTVLANEQVVEGRCWRCGSIPEKRNLSQWYLKITDYAQELLDDLDKLTGWPENVKAQQRNWIGRSEGAEIDFRLADTDGVTPTDRTITVFTTRADTLFGVSFMVLPPESDLAAELVAGTEHEEEFKVLKAATEKVSSVDRQGTAREKHGVFTGRYVINPITGKPAPIWVADYVLMDYGTGAVMGVPCGDQRDFDFARKYGLPIPPIICQKEDPLYDELKDERELASRTSTGTSHGGRGLPRPVRRVHGHEGRQALRGRRRHRRLARGARLRPHEGPVPPARLAHQPPALLGQPHPDDSLRLSAATCPCPRTAAGAGCLTTSTSAPARRSPSMRRVLRDDLPQVRHVRPSASPTRWTPSRAPAGTTCATPTPTTTRRPSRSEAVDRWMPVDNYIGGIEHAILHLLYSRFWTKVLRDMGMIDEDEPFTNLLCQGMVKDEHGDTMSKSKGNVVPPSSVIEPYGADTMRLAILFVAPPEKDFDWDPEAVAGANRFIKRAWRDGVAARRTAPRRRQSCRSRKTLRGQTQGAQPRAQRAGHQVHAGLRPRPVQHGHLRVMELVNAASKYVNDVPDGHARLRAWPVPALLRHVTMLAPIARTGPRSSSMRRSARPASVYNEPWPEFDAEQAKSQTWSRSRCRSRARSAATHRGRCRCIEGRGRGGGEAGCRQLPRGQDDQEGHRRSRQAREHRRYLV
jgi:leucyl-tRNA synthetase